MANTVRISKDPAKFDAYMNITDDLQKSDDPITSQKKYLGWGWKDAESTQWSAFRVESNLLYAAYIDPDKTGKSAIAKMKAHIKAVRKYDNNKTEGHHLLDKVALNGTLDDCFTFNVVRGTSLEADPVRHEDDPSGLFPVITFKKHELGSHVLAVVSAETPDSKKLPDGMAFAKVYRYIGKTAPTKLSQYEFAGNAKRGEFTSEFPDLEIPEGEAWEAWYFGRYESKKGALGNPGPVVNAPVMVAAP
jgi:hypothetical protein